MQKKRMDSATQTWRAGRGPAEHAPAGLALPLGVVLAWLAAGCAHDRAGVEKNLMSDRNSAARAEGVADCYRAGYPDVLDLTIADRADLSGRRPIDLSGRLDFGHYGSVRVQGRTPAEIARLVAEQVHADPAQVRVRVAEFKSQHLYLFGEVIGWQRVVSYQGQETVLDALQRVGGITPGAAPDDVYVVRPHVADGQRPEVFHVDLAAIVLQRDFKTNIRLQPDDQIFVGETRQSRLERCVPPVLRPLFQSLCGTRPEKKDAPAAP
jgi:polysaccharide export outer membrane protein